jgi:predicted nucleotidyltransferase
MTERTFEYTLYQEERGMLSESRFAVCYTTHASGVPLKVMSVTGHPLAKRIVDMLNEKQVSPH